MKLHIRKLLNYSTEQLWDMLDGDFILVFDNGEQINTNYKETLFSSYFWDLFRQYPNVVITPNMHISGILDGKTISTKFINTLLSNIVYLVYDTYTESNDQNFNAPLNKILFRETLAKHLYEMVNTSYNELSYKLEEYVVTINIEDFIEVVRNEEILKARDQFITEKAVNDVYNTIHRVIIDEPEKQQISGDKYTNKVGQNILSLLARSGIVDQGQLDQCVGLRGFITDIDSYQFPLAVQSNLVEGIVNFYESLTESRSAAKSLGFTQKPLQETEYFNRRSQLGALPIRYLIPGDCGSKVYLEWKVRNGDLRNLQGKYYLDEQTNTLAVVKKTDNHLLGKTLKLRTTLGGCAHPVQEGVCETCFGTLSKNFFRNTNLGKACTVEINEKVSQAVLKTKHLDGSSKIEDIHLSEEGKKFLTIKNGDTYLLNPRLAGKDIKLVINPTEALGFTDIREVTDIRDLSYTRTTQLDRIGIEYKQGEGSFIVGIDVGVKRRPASISPDMLMYIRDKSWIVDDEGRYLIDLKDWDHKKVMMIVPRRNVNMSDYSKEIASMLESSKDKSTLRYRNNELTRTAFITEFFDLVNSRLSVNLAVLEIVAYSSMVVDTNPENPDYSLPRANTRYGFGAFKLNIEHRSLGAMMAYQEQHDALTDASSFIHKNRIDSPMDIFIKPQEVLDAYNETIPGYS